MAVGTLDKETVRLVADKLWMEEKLDLTLFQITNVTLGPVNVSDHKQGVRMVARMKRKVTTEMMTTYFPTILLMAITYATTFFKPIFFEASLTVNLTTMLVMTTIFISKMESLPPTSDIKMIDIWLILCQLVPFVEVVALTAIEYHRETEENSWTDDGQVCKGKKTKFFGNLARNLEIVGERFDQILYFLTPFFSLRGKAHSGVGAHQLHRLLWDSRIFLLLVKHKKTTQNLM